MLTPTQLAAWREMVDRNESTGGIYISDASEALRVALPALLDEVERLRCRMDTLLKSLATTQGCCPYDVDGCNSNLAEICTDCWNDHIDRILAKKADALYKCLLYGDTASMATDWRCRQDACGQYQERKEN